MGEDKFYAIKKCDYTGDYYWDFDNFRTWGDVETGTGFLPLGACERPVFSNKVLADRVASNYGGHVVTLAEVPKKRVLTKEQAQILENALKSASLTGYISQHCTNNLEELLLIAAYFNGYSVQKEKKYNVKVPHAVNSYFKKIDANGCIAGDKFYVDLDEDLAQFTKSEINHYGLQDCEKEEVIDDD